MARDRVIFGRDGGDFAIPSGKEIASPDGKYKVYLRSNAPATSWAGKYVIENNQTKIVDDSIEMPTVLLFLRWTANSKSFVSIEHIANGSYGRVVYLRNHRWKSQEIAPPGNQMMKYSVTKLELGDNSAHLTFSVTYIKPNGYPINDKTCDIKVDIENGCLITTKWSPSSGEK